MIQSGFSLCYDGSELVGTGELQAPGGLLIQCREKRYEAFDAVEWVLELRNVGAEDTGLITDLFDCDVFLPLKRDPERFPGNCLTDDCAAVYAMNGMTDGGAYHADDRTSAGEFRLRKRYIVCGATLEYRNGEFGRSSDGQAPFFDVNYGEEGYLVCVGWTGGWRALFTRGEADIRVRTGLRNIGLRLHPGETVRATSVFLMRYADGQTEARNRFRRLIRERLSPFGKGERPEHAPLAFESFGGMPSGMMKEHLNALKRHGVRFDVHWIDAGWQGNSKAPCSNCYTGDWYRHTGEYFINTNYHPMELSDVVAAGEEIGMRLMLWFEPERVLACAPLFREHPEFFLEWPDADRRNPNRSVLLNLGNEEAWHWCFEMLCGLIDKLHVAVYRQDFNCDPAACWAGSDASERRGMAEIRHIAGLYRLWDALLMRYPSLTIDNCASGGRRIDMETIRRSFPFCRSDFHCGFNANPDVVQSQNTGVSLYLPYSGCWTKIGGDRYAIRSTYSASMGVGSWCADFQTMSEADLALLRTCIDEYHEIRRFLSRDFYPLCAPELDDTAWTAWQYGAPEEDAGVVIAFRRANSPLTRAAFPLRGLRADRRYRVTFRDEGRVASFDGAVLAEEGLTVEISERRDSRVITYRAE